MMQFMKFGATGIPVTCGRDIGACVLHRSMVERKHAVDLFARTA